MIRTGFNFKKYKIKKTCTLCKSTNLKVILNFGKTPLANSYPKNKKKEFFCPLTVVLCRSCGHSQLRELVNPSTMFSNYLYVSGTSKILKKHFEDYALKIIKKFNLKKTFKNVRVSNNNNYKIGNNKLAIRKLKWKPKKNLNNIINNIKYE